MSIVFECNQKKYKATKESNKNELEEEFFCGIDNYE